MSKSITRRFLRGFHRNARFFDISNVLHGTVIFLIALIAAEAVLWRSTNELREAKLEYELKQYPKIVKYDKTGFHPEELNVQVGELVTFTNFRGAPFWPASNLHPSHEIYPEFDPQHSIIPQESWSFVFDRPGKWSYHDHVFPNATGRIIVSPAVGKIKSTAVRADKDVSSCEDLALLSEKQGCWDEKLATAIKTKGLDAAFKLFIDLYQTEPSIPKACHGWSHVLGTAAFQLFKENKDFIFRKETSYCGYGFFHGFIEKLLQDTGDVKATREFCQHASDSMGKEAPGVYRNCLHGIGHGSVNIDDPALWGDFQAMIEPGLKTCEAILTDPLELRECYDGAFNAMMLNLLNRDFKLDVDWEDVYGLCRKQKEVYQNSCYFEFTGFVIRVSGRDFSTAAEMIMAVPDRVGAQRVMLKLSADFFQDDIANADYTKNVEDCRALPDDFYRSCFAGILLGFSAHGEPEREYVKGLEFCRYKILTADERELCYNNVLSRTVEKNSPVCNSVEERYRMYCH